MDRGEAGRTFRIVLRLARADLRGAALVALLGLAAAVFEGVGLSFLIPLASYAARGEVDLDAPVIGPALRALDAATPLEGWHMLALVVGFFSLGVLVNFANAVVSSALATRFAHRLRRRVFDGVLGAALPTIDARPAGEVFNALASDTWRVCDALFAVIRIGVQGVYCAVLLGFLLLLSPFNTLLLTAMILAMAAAVRIATRATRRLGADVVAANEDMMAHMWDSVRGLRVIRGFAREPAESARFEQRSRRLRDVYLRLGFVSSAVDPITQIMTVATVAAIVGVAILRGDPIATLAGFLAIAYRMQPRISSVLSGHAKLRELAGSVRSVDALLADTDAHAARSGGRPLAAPPRRIEVRRATARWPRSDRQALSEVSCAFSRGRVTAVLGPSGAGKSTLVALLLRFIEPESGSVLVDDVPLGALDPADWRRHVAFVEQNAFLFNATVAENIAYGAPGAPREAIRAAARAAQAEDFILRLPQGYDTLIGDKGIDLSQGQRQRVALARALACDPDLLILDEATNAVDAPTERDMRRAIDAARGARMVVVIAHRRETIEHADEVIVLDHGRVVETGTPAALMRAGGLFAALYGAAEPVREAV